jgi:uncharacterized membrane protein
VRVVSTPIRVNAVHAETGVRRGLNGATTRAVISNADYLKLGLALACGATALATRSRSRNLCIISGFAGAALVGLTAVGVTRRELHRRRELGTEIVRTITINRSVDDVYAYWRDLTNLPRVFTHLESVQPSSELRSEWRTKPIAGTSATWNAEIVEDVPGAAIAWRTVDGSDLEHEGRVQFLLAPGDRGTEVHVRLCYAAPGGVVGAVMAKLLGADPAQRIGTDLRRLKQILETGAVMRSDASIHRGMHPARPLELPARADWRIA